MIELKNISFAYGKNSILNSVDMYINNGTTAAIVGNSGCGKSTLLKILAGQLPPSGGTLSVGGQELTHVPVSKRNIGYIAQDAYLFPHLTVAENIAFPLEVRKMEKKIIKDKVQKIAERMSLNTLLRNFPHELSGGQKQRVNFARAMVWRPLFVLLDEPFASLDSHTKSDMLSFYNELKVADPFTALYVTHDVSEALLVSDAQHRLEAGKIIHYLNAKEFVLAPENNLKQIREYWRNIEKIVGE